MPNRLVQNSTALAAPELVRGIVSYVGERTWAQVLLAFLFCLLNFLYQGFELYAFGKQLKELASWFYSRCSCGKKRALRNWERLGRDPTLFWTLEERARHDLAVRTSWTWWAQLSAALRNPAVGAPQTWAHWSQWSGRVRRHRWQKSKKSRAQWRPAVVGFEDQ